MRKYKVKITRVARADLATIYDHIANQSSESAVLFLQGLTRKIFDLANNGVAGSSRDWVSKGLRAFPYKNRCIYFRIIKNEMIILRVLHGKQDVNRYNF